MEVNNLSVQVVANLAKAARAAQTLMKEQFGVNVMATGHWGTYTQTAYAKLSTAQQNAVRTVVSAYNADLSTIVEIARQASVKTKAPAVVGRPSNSESQKVFNEQIVPAVLKSAKTMGFRSPSLAVAQLAHESAKGLKVSGSFNYGGIKATTGEPGSVLKTTEYVGGVARSVMAKFKDYPNPAAFVDDYLRALIRKWPRTMSSKTGDEWAAALIANPKMMYYTASPAVYASAINRLEGQYASMA